MQVEAKYIDSREEWLRWRMADVTGSDLGALAGCDKNKSARALYEEKVSGVIDDADNAVLQRGRWMEAAVIEAIREYHPGWTVARSGEYLRAPEHRLGGTPDARAIIDEQSHDNPILIECKSVIRRVFDEDWADGPPMKYQLQALANAMLCNAEHAIIAVLISDYATVEYREFEVPRHAQAEDRILRMVSEFWERIEAQNPPDFDFSADADLIRAVYGKPSLPSVDLSTDNRISELCEQKLEWAERRKNAEAALKEIDAEICARLGDAEIGEHPDYSISWKLQRRKEFVVPAKEFRVLRVTQKHKKSEAA